MRISLENVARRNVYLLVYPKPVTFAERTAVLKALQPYGKIVAFKKLNVRIRCSRVEAGRRGADI
jgi:hypothetical protein